MRLFKKNRGVIIIEFVIVLPLFLILVSVINDISNFVRIRTTIEELSASVVNVPFYLQPKDEVITREKMQKILRTAAKAFVVSYKLYMDSKRSPKLSFCWTAVSKTGVLWKMWLNDSDGSLSFVNSNIGLEENFNGYTSSITPEQYSSAVGGDTGKVLVLEVFLNIEKDIQFIKFFRFFNANLIHVRMFGVPKTSGQLPDLLNTQDKNNDSSSGNGSQS